MTTELEDIYRMQGFQLHSYDVGETVNSPFPAKEDCIYTACYCEENIYKLCEKLQERSSYAVQNSYVVFVSNELKKVPLWHQKAGHNSVGLVVWDYHVFLVYQQSNNCLVYDFDTMLPFPTPFYHYLSKTFRSDKNLKPDFYRKFRVIDGPTYLNKFASDRRHMITDGMWLKEPPSYLPISTPECKHNLESFISMSADEGYGEVLTLAQFCKRFAKSSETVSLNDLQLML
ncbi:N-terminal glutamine amidase tungus [Lycorma delicatula]|uniref:N-terminal glutamine amidase tungus n=1 Tax=Lycorma delicatula TaxID=130591 RepID=UPI003F510DFF